MAFYFVCYVLVGFCFGMAMTVHLSSQDYRRLQLSTFWINSNANIGSIIIAFCSIAPLLALVTSLVQGGLWVFLTLGEIALGAIIARFLVPIPLMNLLMFLAIPVLIIIFGALWGFWYI